MSQRSHFENFGEELQLEPDPQINEKRKMFGEIMEVRPPAKEHEAETRDFTRLLGDLLEMSNAESFIDMVLERNEIKIGEFVCGRLDNPIIRIFADRSGGCQEQTG
ncbi:Uncharacterised protein [uncultured archaeon]|nr:Uncharacterised protein [uncultured archaeon]